MELEILIGMNHFKHSSKKEVTLLRIHSVIEKTLKSMKGSILKRFLDNMVGKKYNRRSST